jgi:uncharacterized protein DUF1493
VGSFRVVRLGELVLVESGRAMSACESFIIEVLARRTGLDHASIKPEARLLQDLKLDGDDAIDAIREISSRCGMDVSQFRAELYFRSEPSLLSLFRRSSVPERVLTVGQLIEAAEQGALR